MTLELEAGNLSWGWNLEKIRAFLMVTILMFSLPSTALGDKEDYYIMTGMGLLFYNDDIDQKTRLDDAFDGELSFGRYLYRNMALEFITGYIHDGHERSDIKAFSLALAAVWSYPLSQKHAFSQVAALHTITRNLMVT